MGYGRSIAEWNGWSSPCMERAVKWVLWVGERREEWDITHPFMMNGEGRNWENEEDRRVEGGEERERGRGGRVQNNRESGQKWTQKGGIILCSQLFPLERKERERLQVPTSISIQMKRVNEWRRDWTRERERRREKEKEREEGEGDYQRVDIQSISVMKSKSCFSKISLVSPAWNNWDRREEKGGEGTKK